MTIPNSRRLTLRNQLHARPRRGGFAALLAGVVALSALTLPAAAQIGGSLPDEIVASNSLSADDKAKMVQYVRAHSAGLTGDQAAIKEARGWLLSPLRKAEVGTSFRVEYAEVLLAGEPKGAPLRELLKNPNEHVAINAAVILGEVGAKSSLDALLSVVTENETRPSVRLTAVLGIGRTFDAIRTPAQPALSKSDAVRAITSLEAAFRAEKEADVADAIASAFDSASRVPEDKLLDVRNEAANHLAAAVQARIKDTNAAGFTRAWARAGATMIAGVKSETPNTAFSRDSIVTAAGTAGDLLGLVVRRVSPGLPEGAGGVPDDLVQIAGEAETLWTFCKRKIDGGSGSAPPASYNFDRSLNGTPPVGDKPGTPPDIDKFKSDAAKLIGPGGELTKPPFAFKPDRFN